MQGAVVTTMLYFMCFSMQHVVRSLHYQCRFTGSLQMYANQMDKDSELYQYRDTELLK